MTNRPARADAHVIASVLGQWSQPRTLLSSALADALDAAIVGGAVPSGWALPSQRRLSDVLGVSRGTVASAYEILRFTGRVDGSARVVARTAGPAGVDASAGQPGRGVRGQLAVRVRSTHQQG